MGNNGRLDFLLNCLFHRHFFQKLNTFKYWFFISTKNMGKTDLPLKISGIPYQYLLMKIRPVKLAIIFSNFGLPNLNYTHRKKLIVPELPIIESYFHLNLNCKFECSIVIHAKMTAASFFVQIYQKCILLTCHFPNTLLLNISFSNCA